MSNEPQPGLPPLPIRMVARGVSAVIARAPFLWPVLRRPTRRWWDRMAERWDDRVGARFDERTAPLAAACDRLETEPRRILELGTGTGAGATMLVGRFPNAEVWAVDLSEAMIRQAREKAPGDATGRLHLEVADAGALPYEAKSFDLVCQQNLPLFAEEIARVLAPGGYVAIASTLGPRTPYYTPDRVLRRRFERLGLKVVETGGAGAGTYFLAQRPD